MSDTARGFYVIRADRPDSGVDDGSRLTGGERSLVGLLTLLPGRRDDAIAVVDCVVGDALDECHSPVATLRAGAVISRSSAACRVLRCQR